MLVQLCILCFVGLFWSTLSCGNETEKNPEIICQNFHATFIFNTRQALCYLTKIAKHLHEDSPVITVSWMHVRHP